MIRSESVVLLIVVIIVVVVVAANSPNIYAFIGNWLLLIGEVYLIINHMLCYLHGPEATPEAQLNIGTQICCASPTCYGKIST